MYSIPGTSLPQTGSIPNPEIPYIDGRIYVSDSIYLAGNPGTGNYASVSYTADIDNGVIQAHTQSNGDVTDFWPYTFTSNGRVNLIRLSEQLNFLVPAGTYEAGVHVGIEGTIVGTVSSTLAAGAQVVYSVQFGSDQIISSPQLVDVDESATLIINESFSLSTQIVADGVTLNEAQTFPVSVSAGLFNCYSWSVVQGSGQDRICGSAEVDFSDGIRFLQVTKPASVSWTSDSGVFLEDGCPVPMADQPCVRLLQNSPNPFNPSTLIRYELDQPAAVTLGIYDLGGRCVRTLLRGVSEGVGPHQQIWDGQDDLGAKLPSAVYFYKISAGGETRTRRMVLLK